MNAAFVFFQPIWLGLLQGLSAYGEALCSLPTQESRHEP
jgi:hypothetical protein